MKKVTRPHHPRGVPGAYGQGYRRERARVMATTPEVCAICGGGPRRGDPWESDHRTPAKHGGGWMGNLQRAHRSCNRAKGGRGSGRGPTVLVTGPPCSGKTTFARAHATGPIADRDYMSEAAYRATASQPGAWIIATAPTRRERGMMREKYNVGRTVVMLTPAAVCLERLAQQDRDQTQVARAIVQWWRDYRPSTTHREVAVMYNAGARNG